MKEGYVIPHSNTNVLWKGITVKWSAFSSFSHLQGFCPYFSPLFLFFGNLIRLFGYTLWSFSQSWSLVLNFPLPSTCSFLPVPLVSQDAENWPSVVKVKPVPSPTSNLCYDTSKLSVILYSSTTINTQVRAHVPSPELLQWLPPVAPSLTSRPPAAKLTIFLRCCPDYVTPLIEIFIYCSP